MAYWHTLLLIALMLAPSSLGQMIINPHLFSQAQPPPVDPTRWTNINLRVMAANLNGDSQKIEPFAIRIFQGLKPDVVAIQEFNYLSSSPADIRAFVDMALGTNFVYFREGGYSIPNGIISRYPILAAGTWNDIEVANRGFAWAKVELPGTNHLYVVSVHFLTTSPSVRARQASNLKTLIQANFPTNAWIVVAGDMNTDSRSEAAISTFTTFLSDSPIPTDAVTGGNPDTNNGRNKPFDYVLPSYNFAALQTNTVFASFSFPKGLVFDSRVYTPLSDVAPVLFSDSGYGQHMGVLKDFHIPFLRDGVVGPVAPYFIAQPQSQTVMERATVTFSATAGGDLPLSYQWHSNQVAIPGADSTNYIISSAQPAHEATYSVVVTNSYGSVTSAPALLKITGYYSGILAGWDMSGVTGFGPSPMSPTTNASMVVAGGLTRGPGLTTNPTAASRAWGANGFGASSPAAAIAEGDYVTFSVAAASGYTISVEAIGRFGYRRSSTGPTDGILQARIGDGAFADVAILAYSSALSTGGSLPTIDLAAFPQLQSIPPGTAVTFRIVNYNGASTGNWYIYDTLNSPEPDLAITGTLNRISSPPPTAPSLTSLVLSPSGWIKFELIGDEGSEYVVESATESPSGPWTAISTNLPGSSISIPASEPYQFFRARALAK
jgi:endonuclease/exonuclease/phosphatase family metal-dependent hydrolase